MYIHFLIHSSVNEHLGCFYILAIMNRVFRYFFVSLILGYMPSSGIAGSCGSSISSFLRHPHTLLHSGCTHLHSHQECTRALFPSILPTPAVSFFSAVLILMSVRWSLLVTRFFCLEVHQSLCDRQVTRMRKKPTQG